MALNEQSLGIIYLLKVTGKSADGVLSLIRDYDYRESHGLLDSNPNAYDKHIAKVVAKLASKDVSLSTFIARYNTALVNIQKSYWNYSWLNDTESDNNTIPAVYTQSDLDSLADTSWAEGNGGFTLLTSEFAVRQLDFSDIGSRFTLVSSEEVTSNRSILNSSMLKLTFEEGVSEEGWDGVTVTRNMSIYPGHTYRITLSESRWEDFDEEVKDPEAPEETSEEERELWNAMLVGFERGMAYSDATVVKRPVTAGVLWVEAALGAAALGGYFGERLKNIVGSEIYVSANSETRGYSGEGLETWEYESLAKRVAVLAKEVGVYA